MAQVVSNWDDGSHEGHGILQSNDYATWVRLRYQKFLRYLTNTVISSQDMT
jgi:hypothetical protein